MNFRELEPTTSNLLSSLEEDLIGRNNELVHFYKLLCNIDGKMSISIDGEWGCGKTFFVKQAEMLINSLNISSKSQG